MQAIAAQRYYAAEREEKEKDARKEKKEQKEKERKKLAAAAEGGGVTGAGGEEGEEEEEEERGGSVVVSPNPEVRFLQGGGGGGEGGREGGMASNPDRWNIKSGRIDVEGLFKISSTGIVFANDERHHHSPLINREGGNNFIELMELGAGNGGAVFKVRREGGKEGRIGEQPARLRHEQYCF